VDPLRPVAVQLVTDSEVSAVHPVTEPVPPLANATFQLAKVHAALVVPSVHDTTTLVKY